jgi:hypothetical protein
MSNLVEFLGRFTKYVYGIPTLELSKEDWSKVIHCGFNRPYTELQHIQKGVELQHIQKGVEWLWYYEENGCKFWGTCNGYTFHYIWAVLPNGFCFKDKKWLTPTWRYRKHLGVLKEVERRIEHEKYLCDRLYIANIIYRDQFDQPLYKSQGCIDVEGNRIPMVRLDSEMRSLLDEKVRLVQDSNAGHWKNSKAVEELLKPIGLIRI